MVEKIKSLKEIKGVHDLHAWSLDGEQNVVSFHVTVEKELFSSTETVVLKNEIKRLVKELGNYHITIEIENDGEHCPLLKSI